MFKRFPRSVGLAFAVSLLISGQAEANIWDWLEELNGPGPSRSRGNFMVNLICTGTPGTTSTGERRALGRFLQLPSRPSDDATCLFVDQRWLHAEEDSRFHPVDISITEIGASVWMHRTAELGAGIGVMKFSSTNPLTKDEFEGARMTISFPRLAFKPLLAIPSARIQNNSNWGFLQLYFKETIVVGDLSNTDFASKPGTEFNRRHQRVESMGFIIDATALLGLIRGHS